LPLARALDVPLVVTLHGFDVTMRDDAHRALPIGRLYLRRRKVLWNRASLFICVSKFIRAEAIERGFPKEKLRVQYIGIDCDAFAPRQDTACEDLIVFVGRLVEKKGCEYLLKAMSKVRQHRSSVRLAVVGDGPLRSSLQELARTLQIDCQFIGAQPASVVRDWLRQATVFCGPSVTARNGDSEGLGLVFLEAQAMGVPVVSFRHGGIPEAVQHGRTGLLAEEGNYEELADGILRFLVDVELRRRCGRNGIDQVRTHFDIHRQTRKLEQLYEEILAP
jgi:glycosyltransferase involved in cell wall biosynthesis